MTEENKISNSQTTRVLKLINEMTLFDDDLMTLVFNQNVPAIELLLRIVLGRKITVKEHSVQVEFRNPISDGRNITLDVVAVESNGAEIDIEVQGNSTGAHVRRARYHSAALDYRMLRKNQEFNQLRDSYVIFIYKHDKFGKGLPIYKASRFVEETGEPLEDGSHIIYVNGAYKGNDAIGKLMHDFNSLTAEGMNYKELAAGVHHFKETEKGRDTMCESVKQYAKEYAEEYAKECTMNNNMEQVKNVMSKLNYTLEEALDLLNISGKDRKTIIQQFQK